MNRVTSGSGLFGRLWQLVRETSEVAVAVHYDAPWMHVRRSCDGTRCGA